MGVATGAELRERMSMASGALGGEAPVLRSAGAIGTGGDSAPGAGAAPFLAWREAMRPERRASMRLGNKGRGWALT